MRVFNSGSVIKESSRNPSIGAAWHAVLTCAGGFAKGVWSLLGSERFCNGGPIGGWLRTCELNWLQTLKSCPG